MPESEGDFKKFLESIPQEVAKPLEPEEGRGDLTVESQNLVNALDVIKESEGTKEAQIALLPRIKGMIAALREAQAKNDSEPIRNSITRLVAERERIETMIN